MDRSKRIEPVSGAAQNRDNPKKKSLRELSTKASAQRPISNSGVSSKRVAAQKARRSFNMKEHLYRNFLRTLSCQTFVYTYSLSKLHPSFRVSGAERSTVGQASRQRGDSGTQTATQGGAKGGYHPLITSTLGHLSFKSESSCTAKYARPLV